MRLYEYESKLIFSKSGIPTPLGKVVSSPQEARDVAKELAKEVVLKPQILATGRGKAGAIKFAEGPEQAESMAGELLGMELLGFKVKKLLVEERLEKERELYAGVTYNNSLKRPAFVVSPDGGVDVNELALKHPQRVHTFSLSVRRELPSYKGRELAKKMELPSDSINAAVGLLQNLYDVFKRFDALLTEVNPLVLTHDHRLMAADAHIVVDDDALFRHPELSEMGIERREDRPHLPTEFEMKVAEIDSIDYRGVAGRVIEFDGNLGLLIGGGGASLSIFDAIRRYGGNPANYCEIGGNPTVRKVRELTKLIISKRGVEGLAVITNILSNTRVDLLARGVIKAMMDLNIDPKSFPIIFRSAGAYEADGYKILEKYGVEHLDRRASIDLAARVAVEMMQGKKP